jgi:RHS repeat-associated protein
MTGANGAPSETRAYNSIGQMKQLTQGSLNVQYNYPTSNNNGKIQSDTDVVSGETVTYTYDSLNRLASATSSTPNWGQSFGYDGFGNLNNVAVTKGSAPTLSVSYNASSNRRSSDCSDGSGNISPCGNTYSFDAANRVTGVNLSSGATYYSYDPSNRRVWRGDGSTLDELTYYSASGAKLCVYNLSTSGSDLRATSAGTFDYFAGKMLRNPSGWINQDRLGSVGKYFPYGQDRGSSNPSNGTEKFATYKRDSESGLDYAVNRYEAPGDGRFLSPDPYQPSAGPEDPSSWNRYAYVGGDPINFIDPTGLLKSCPKGDGCKGGGGPGDDDICSMSLEQFIAKYGQGWIGYYFQLCGGGPISRPDPDPNPDPPDPPQPECFAELKYRAVDIPGNRNGYFIHTFWYVQDSSGKQWIVHGGPDPQAPEGTYGSLHIWKDPVSVSTTDTPAAGTAWSSGLSAANCAGADALLAAAGAWNQNKVDYDPTGTNSNTAAHFLGNSGGFKPTFSILKIGVPLGWDSDFGPTLGGINSRRHH